MDDGEHNYLIAPRVEVNRVREPPKERAPRLTLDERVCKRCLEDFGQDRVDFRGERDAELRTLRFVPVTGLE